MGSELAVMMNFINNLCFLTYPDTFLNPHLFFSDDSAPVNMHPTNLDILKSTLKRVINPQRIRQHVDGEILESGKKKLRIKKCPDTCVRCLKKSTITVITEACFPFRHARIQFLH